VRRHPDYHKPELLASGPNRLWSWDITKLKGRTWTYFYLYLHDPQRLPPLHGGAAGGRAGVGHLGRPLITETCRKQGITPEKLTLHADRGSAMNSKKVALLLADLDNKLNEKIIHPTT